MLLDEAAGHRAGFAKQDDTVHLFGDGLAGAGVSGDKPRRFARVRFVGLHQGKRVGRVPREVGLTSFLKQVSAIERRGAEGSERGSEHAEAHRRCW